MQARLRLVQHEQAGRPRCQQRGNPEQISQRAVGKLRGLQRTEQTVLLHLELEPAAAETHGDAASWKRIVDRPIERLWVADFPDRLQRRSQVGAVVAEDGRVRADL